jgi:hypothetical protein
VCVSSASTGPCGGQRVNRCPYRDPGPARSKKRPDESGRGRHECLRHGGPRSQCEVILAWLLRALSAANWSCRPADTENGFADGPVFLDWRRGRFAGGGVARVIFTETPKDL